MLKPNFKQDKGTAGLTILLSLIVMLFVIGLLVMIFTIMGSKIQDSTYDATTVNVQNETVASLNKTVGNSLAGASYRNAGCTILVVTNATNTSTVIPSTNYSVTGCLLTGEANSLYLNKPVNVTYTYTWDKDNTATDVMNDTVKGVSGVTDWFDIFIVIGAMVVLILLTVIIITAIRSSGMVEGAGSKQGAGVGTA